MSCPGHLAPCDLGGETDVLSLLPGDAGFRAPLSVMHIVLETVGQRAAAPRKDLFYKLCISNCGWQSFYHCVMHYTASN